MSFLTRYEDDPSRPEVRSALRDLGMRVLLPGLVVFGIVVGLGKLIVASKAYSDAEERVVNRALAAERDSTWNTITMFWSHIGNTEYVIGVCIIVALIGYLLVQKGLNSLKAENLKPRQTAGSLRENKEWLQEQAREI